MERSEIRGCGQCPGLRFASSGLLVQKDAAGQKALGKPGKTR